MKRGVRGPVITGSSITVRVRAMLQWECTHWVAVLAEYQSTWPIGYGATRKAALRDLEQKLQDPQL